MSPTQIRTHLGGLPDECSEEDLRPVARALATHAASKDQPLKSLAAFERHNLELPHVPRLIELAKEELPLVNQDAPPREAPAPSMRWLTVEAVASVLPSTSVKALKQRLRMVEGRRALGWAWWDGYRWLIPEPAIDPLTRAGYMAELPSTEPEAHRRQLPEWCERTPV